MALGWFSPTAEAKGGAYNAGTCNTTDVHAGSFSAITCGNFEGNDSQVGFLDALNEGSFESLEGYKSFSPDFESAISALDGTWSLFGKSDEGGDKVNDLGEELLSGGWSFSEALTDPFVVVLKASDYYSAYLFKDFDEAIESGEFNVQGVTSHKKKEHNFAALSHMSVYSFAPRVQKPEPVDIPEPTALAGLLAIAGFGAYGRKRSLKSNSGSAV
jgi:hypothetical protein